MQKNQLITIEGQVIDVLDLDVSKISMQSIARRLSKICRFGGEIEDFYSVAQHCVNVSHLGLTLIECQDGLMHENGEAFMGDLATPIKYLTELSGYRTLEKQINKLLLMHFTGRSVFCDNLKSFDSAALMLEASAFHPVLYGRIDASDSKFNYYFDNCNEPDDYLRLKVDLRPLPPKEAEKLFLDRYAELFNDNS